MGHLAGVVNVNLAEAEATRVPRGVARGWIGHTRTIVFARPVIVSQPEWETSLRCHHRAGEDRRRSDRPARCCPQADADGPRRARLPVQRSRRRTVAAELFDGRRQLILYRFFFEDGVDGWPEAGCPGCSSWADGIGQLGLLHARDITLAMASPAPQENLRRYAERMGWTHIPWYTIRTERFSADFGTEESFGLNVFLRDGDDVYRTYFLQHGAMVRTIGSVATLISPRPTADKSMTRTPPKAGRRRPASSGAAGTTSSTNPRRRRGQRTRPRGHVTRRLRSRA